MGLKRYPTPFLPKNERKDPLSFGAFYDPVRTPPPCFTCFHFHFLIAIRTRRCKSDSIMRVYLLVYSARAYILVEKWSSTGHGALSRKALYRGSDISRVNSEIVTRQTTLRNAGSRKGGVKVT
jgi:hypothetical protein